MVQIQPGSVLMSESPVAMESYADAWDQGCHLKPCKCSKAMRPMGPPQSEWPTVWSWWHPSLSCWQGPCLDPWLKCNWDLCCHQEPLEQTGSRPPCRLMLVSKGCDTDLRSLLCHPDHGIIWAWAAAKGNFWCPWLCYSHGLCGCPWLLLPPNTVRIGLHRVSCPPHWLQN